MIEPREILWAEDVDDLRAHTNTVATIWTRLEYKTMATLDSGQIFKEKSPRYSLSFK